MFGGRILILLFLISAISVDISLASPDIEWTKTFGGTGEDLAYSVKETSDLGYILAGYTYSYGAGSSDVYLIKTNSSGDKIWERTYGYSFSEIGRSVLQTQDGGYIIAGYTNSTGAGKFDVWLIKTNQNGNVIWNKTFGGTNNDYGRSVQQTTDGGYIIGGETYSYGAGGSDFYLIKTDSNGNNQWQKALGSNKDDGGYSVKQTSDGGYILAGYTYRYMANPQDKDIWVIKTYPNGSIKWEKGWGNEYPDTGYDAQQADDGGYVVAGYFSSDSTFYVVKTDSNGNQIWGGGFGTRDGWQKPYSIQQTLDKGYIVVGESNVILDPTLYNAFLVKIDANGNKKWNKTVGGSNDDLAYAVQQTTYEDYIIAGTTRSFGAGGFDVYLVKIYSDNPIAHCRNLKKDFDEEGIDCGGSCKACVSCSNRIKDGDEEGVDCGGSCPNSCAKLKILALPLRWKGSQASFDNAVDTQLNFFINAIPLKNCTETIKVDKLDVDKYNFNNFTCSKTNCGVYKIKPFVEKKGINVKDYDHIIGFIENSSCSPIMGCGNGKDAAWVTTAYEIVAAHEIGHFYGLEDEYCSNQAGSDDFRCNDGNELWWLFGFIPIPPLDKNYLDVDLGCNASIGDCCSDCSASGNIFGTGDYFVCCEGNINDKGGRAIMSYAEAQGPRAFDNHSKAHLATFTKLTCPFKLQRLGVKDIIPGKVIDLNLKIFENDSVEEEYIHLVDGEANTYYSEEGNYNISIYDANNNSLFNYSFARYFGYDGPMVKQVNYSILNFTSFELSLKIPYDDNMHVLYLYHENKTIFNKTLEFCNQDNICNGSETHLSCWQDCKPWSLDGVCINRTDLHCDPDCAKQIDDDCWGVFNLSLKQGWNLVSSPLIPDENISTLFGNSTLYSYSNGTWVQLNGNINLSAFWVYKDQNTSVEVAGAKVEENSFILHEGWNLVGYTSLVDTNISTMFTTLNVTSVYSYNGTWLSYIPNRTVNTLTTMKPGYGYWVNVGG